MWKRQSLEDLLVSGQILTEEQRAQASLLAKQSHKPFADTVVRLGLATEDDIAVVLAKEYDLPLAARKHGVLVLDWEQHLERIVPEDFAREHLAVPLFLDKEKKVLAAAFANPDNLLAVENLKVLTGCEIQASVATKTEVLTAIDRLYQGRSPDLIAQTLAGQPAEDLVDSSSADVHVDLDKTAVSGQGLQAVNLVNAILKQAVAERCSDIHLEAYEDDEVMLRFRIDGVLYRRTPPPVSAFLPVISRLKILARLDIAEKRMPQDGSFAVRVHNRAIDVRVSLCPAAYGEKIVLRLLDKASVPLEMEHLGFEARQLTNFLEAAKQPHGLLFLTGPTGSGKTTTLYALINQIKTHELNFMTVEDPIEIRLRGVTQVQVRSNIGLTFAASLRSFLRQDPDVILVGEVRDLETAQTCMRAALTGHLVFSTLHTNDALSAIVRLIDLGVEPFLLSSSLSMVAAQRLVRVLCPHCREAVTPPPSLLRACLSEVEPVLNVDTSRAVFYQAVGCERCSGTGYRGRIGLFEVYRLNAEMREAIYKHPGDIQALRAAASSTGMMSLRASGWAKVLRGITTTTEVLSATTE